MPDPAARLIVKELSQERRRVATGDPSTGYAC